MDIVRARRRVLALSLLGAALLPATVRGDDPPPPPPVAPPTPSAPGPRGGGADPAPPSPPPSAPPTDPPAPPSPSASATAPKAVVDRLEHDFGVTKQEAELRTEFVLRNEGTADLTFESRADCGCSAVSAETARLAPGASTAVRVVFRTFSFAGPVTKRIRIVSNDPTTPVLEMKIKADIAAGVVADPARFFFGPVEIGTSPTVTIRMKWREGAGSAFTITSIEAPGTDLAFTTKAFDEAPWHGFDVTAAFRSPPKVGTVSGTAILRTDSKDAPRVTAAVTAYVSGKIWVDRREASLGMLPVGKDRAVMVGCRALKPDVDLGTVTATARGGKVRARAIRAGPEWLVEIRSPETAVPGRLDDVVDVTCSIPGETAEIVVKGEVLPERK